VPCIPQHAAVAFGGVLPRRSATSTKPVTVRVRSRVLTLLAVPALLAATAAAAPSVPPAEAPATVEQGAS
jgi:hypothetical protein